MSASAVAPARPSETLSDTTTRSALRAMLLRVSGLGLALLANVALARTLGVKAFGLFNYALAWALVVGSLAAIGYPVAVQKLVPSYLSANDHSATGRLLRRSWREVTTISLTIAVLAAAVLQFTAALSIPRSVALLGCCLVPLVALLHLSTGWLKALRRVRTALWPDLLLRPFLLLLLAAGAWSLGRSVGARGALLTTIVALLLALLLQSIVLVQSLRRSAHESDSAQRGAPASAPANEAKAWRKVTLPLLFVSGFALLLKRTDILMLGSLAGSEPVAIYHAAGRLAELTGFVLTAVTVAAPAVFAALWAKREKEQLQLLLQSLSRWIIWPSIAIGLATVALSKPLLGLFGEEFVAGAPIIAILVTGQLFSAAAGPVGFLLSMTGHQRQVARAYAGAVVCNVTLNALAIRSFGAVGAAVATSVTTVGWNLWLLRIASRETGLDPSILNRIGGEKR